jgi:hypothetical protein
VDKEQRTQFVLDGNADGLTAMLRKADANTDKHLGSMKGRFDGLASTITSLSGTLTAFTSGAAFTGISLFVKGAIDFADEIGKMSQKIGMSVEDLSALKYAADLSDVSIEQLGVSLKQMSKNVIEAASGSRDQAAAFKALDVEIKNTDGSLRSNNEILYDIADRFSKLEDNSAKTAIAMKLFGRSGADMIPLLNAGSGGLADMKKEAAAMGVILEEKTTKAAEDFNDNLTRLGTFAQGAGFAIAEYLLPPLVRVTEEMDKIVQKESFFDKLLAWGKFSGKFAGDMIKGGPLLAPYLTGMRLYNESAGETPAAAAAGPVKPAATLMPKTDSALQGLLEAYLKALQGNGNANGNGSSPTGNLKKLGSNTPSSFFSQIYDRNNEELLIKEAASWAGVQLGDSLLKHTAITIQEKGGLFSVLTNNSGKPTSLLGDIDLLGGVVETFDSVAQTLSMLRETNQNRLDAYVMPLEDSENTEDQRNAETAKYEFSKNLMEQEYLDRIAIAQKTGEDVFAIQNLYDSKRILAAAKYSKAMVDLDRREKQQKWQIASYSTSALMNLTNALFIASGQKSKELFIANKVAGIANATVNTAEGVTKALAQGGWFGIAMGAAVAAMGAVQIATIAGTSMDGGGDVSSPSGGIGGFGDGTPQSPVVTQPTATQPSGPGDIHIKIDNFIGEDAWVEGRLVPLLRELHGRNVTIS